MKVCIDGLPYFLNNWDLGEYSRELILSLSKEKTISLFLLRDKEIQKGLIGVNPGVVNISNLSINRLADDNTSILNFLRDNKINLYHCLNNGFSLCNNMDDIFVVTTFHSLIPLEYEDFYKEKYKNKYFNSLSNTLNTTNKFIAPSLSMKNKLINLCNIRNEKIEIIYPTISNEFQPINKYMSHVYLRSKFNIVDDYVLFTGDFHKRKRIEDIIELFFRVSNIDKKLKFIFLTYINEVNVDYFNEMNALITSMNLGAKIKFITSFTTEEKAHFLNGAICFIDLSLYDDMNISMIQALKCKCPIICSDIPLHREILSDCGIFIDMENSNSLELIENYILNIKDIYLYSPKDYCDNIEKFDTPANVNKLVSIYNRTYH